MMRSFKVIRFTIVKVIKSRRVRWAGQVGLSGRVKKCINILVEEPEGRRPLERPRRIWINYIRMDLTEIGRKGVN
jgi:hypothetical protein